ncbi:BON domain-containing protein [Paraburkholderia unamae]|uniref:BON domain-containing protein n=1 Tax=Paraburkholderia unamae TaxID=219649 RepID=UPI000DC3D01E|nr:BON domain-containing protein [Paraburkholderia unamae]RAR57237.1 BON domain-containing protein [Paraburkholderia unamae]CAG9243470.1 BON domain-containing protein [Paraburkholderia unamae]
MRHTLLKQAMRAVLIVAIATCAAYGGTPTGATAGIPASRPDNELVRDVRHAFARTQGLNASSIHVQARNGVVTLTGWVPQRSQISRAADVAGSVNGVRSVSNGLVLRAGHGSGR